MGVAALAACSVALAPAAAQEPADREAAAVKQAFLHAWQGYERYAWGHDELLPVSRGGRDWYPASFLMTPVDAYDTMVLMGLSGEAARAKSLILDSLSFDRDFPVQVFEITIRELGGLLSAYQLDGDPRFLSLARDLGTRLLPAFGSATGMPYRFVNLHTGAVSGPVSNPAEVGTLMLEFGTLGKLTGDPRYYDAAKRAVVAPAQSNDWDRFHRLVCRSHNFVQAAVWLGHSAPRAKEAGQDRCDNQSDRRVDRGSID
ncbi:MAG: glycoside hydrolase family 47 protein [Acidobacteriia bacterium]|nr:glycoside hydrolase family 47 protein [Terriglobia bacterium]